MRNLLKTLTLGCMIAGISAVSAQETRVNPTTQQPNVKTDAVRQAPAQKSPALQQHQPTQVRTDQATRTGVYPATEAYLQRFPNKEYSTMMQSMNDGVHIDTNMRNDLMVKHRTQLGERLANKEITEQEHQALINEMSQTIDHLNNQQPIRRVE